MPYLKRQDRTCWNCGYRWTPIKAAPKACPMCHVYQDRAKYRKGARSRPDDQGSVAAVAAVVVLVVAVAAIAVFFGSGLLPYFTPGCTVQGAVVSLKSGEPIGGARVELGSGGSDLGVTFTGSDGTYRLGVAKAHCNGAVAQLLLTSGVGYRLVSLNLPSAPGETVTAPTVEL